MQNKSTEKQLYISLSRLIRTFSVSRCFLSFRLGMQASPTGDASLKGYIIHTYPVRTVIKITQTWKT